MNCPACQKIGQQHPMGPIQICTECGTAYPARSFNDNRGEFLREHWDRRRTHPRYCRNSPGVRSVLHCDFCGCRVEMAAAGETVATKSGGQAA